MGDIMQIHNEWPFDNWVGIEELINHQKWWTGESQNIQTSTGHINCPIVPLEIASEETTVS